MRELKELRVRVSSLEAEKCNPGQVRSELKESEDKLGQIADNINEVIFMFSPDWRETVYVSPAYKDIWGLPPGELYRNPRSWMDAILPDDAERVAAFVDGQARGEVAYENSIEYRIRTPDGKTRWICGRTYPVRDGQGNIRRITGIAEDVTRRKSTEEQLQNSERFLKDIFDCFQDGISVLDRDLNIIRVNHVMEKWHPYMMPLCGKKCHYAFHKRPGPCERCPSIRAIETGTAQSEEVPFHGEHNERRGWLEVFAYPLKDDRGNVTGVVEHVRDITDRKCAEDALRDNEEKYRSLVENINDMVWEIDDDFRVTYASARTRDLLGYETEEIIGRQPFEFILPADRDLFESLVGDAFRARAPLELMGYRVRHKDGRTIYCETNGLPIFDMDGRFRGYRGINRDVTERKLAEESLQLMQYMIDQVQDEASLAGPDGRFVYVNDAKCRSLGYTRDELLSMNVWDIDPDMSPETWPLAWKGLKEKGSNKLETMHRAKDGRVFPTEIWMTYLSFHGSEYVCALVRDITGRKHAEKSLKLTQFTMDRAGDMVLWVAPDSRFIYVNQAACRAFGYTREEMISMTTFDTCPAWTKKSWAEHWKEIKERGSFTIERSLRRKDGSYFPAEISVNYLVYEGKEYNCSFIRDITDRKQAEEALQENEKKFRALAESTKAGILLFQDREFFYANPMLEKITGYSQEEMKSMDFWQPVHPDYREMVRSRGISRLHGGRQPSTYEFQIITKGGELKWVELSATTINYEGRRTVLATLFDITDRKRSEAELQEAKSEAELYLDLMGHDIRNMNQISIGFLEMAREMPELSNEAKDLISRPLEAMVASTRLIENVGKLRKIKVGGLKLHEVDVGSVIEAVTPRYSNVDGRNIRINSSVGCECRVIANDLLDDVFSNVIGNAIKHSRGPLTVDIHMNEVMVGDRRYCLVAIEDDGPGIPDDLKERLFTRFERGKPGSVGRGLGTYLVRMLVEDFNGKAWVEDRVRGDHTKGTRFMIMLPVVK